MLRPAVAVTNCARAGETSCLDIGRPAPVLDEPDTDAADLPDRSHKLPKRGQNVNEARKTALSHGPAVDTWSVHIAAQSRTAGIVLARDQIESRAKRCFLPVYKKASRGAL